jgi:hypothetical protein
VAHTPHRVAGIGLLQGEGRRTSGGYRRAIGKRVAGEAPGQVLHSRGDVRGALQCEEWNREVSAT